jgi:chromosomal replication initiation ATPase DnaA
MIPRRLKPPTQPPPHVLVVVKGVAKLFNVEFQDVLSGSRVRAVTQARHDVIRQLVERGNSQTQIGIWLGLHHTSVHYYANGRKIRNPRPDPREIPCPDLSGEWAI